MEEFHCRLSGSLFIKGWDLPTADVMALILPAMGSPTRLYLGLCRELARAVAERCGIAHESPQAIVFRDGSPVWHGSHGEVVATALTAALG